MKNATVLIILIFAACFSNAQNYLNQPQKIVIDTARNCYLVSNWGSGGILVRIDSLGVQDPFISNAGMVDAMQIIGDTVYGSALGGRVRAYDLDSRILVMNLDLSGEGVQFLSGFVADSSGILYTSERFGNRIFKINPKTQEYWVFAEGNGIDQPNGMLYEPEYNRILVCLDKPNPPILAINLSDSTVSTVATTNLQGSDGIAKDKFGNYYITGYELSGIYKFDPDFTGEPELFFEGEYIIYPTYNEEHHSLLITYYYQNNWGEILLSTSSVSPDESINEFRLYNNFPNPFNPSTKIQYTIDSRGFVTLKVFDMLGNEVATLINEEKPTGDYEIDFSTNTLQLTSGVYFYQLQAGSSIQTKKMVLLK